MGASSHGYDWHKVTNTEAHHVTGSTETPGYVYPFSTSLLPSQLQKLPGLYEAYCSGYCATYQSPDNVTVLGEIIAAREEHGIGKGYVYLFGISASNVFFCGPYKPYDGHHYNTGSGVPVEKLFGKIQKLEN